MNPAFKSQETAKPEVDLDSDFCLKPCYSVLDCVRLIGTTTTSRMRTYLFREKVPSQRALCFKQLLLNYLLIFSDWFWCTCSWLSRTKTWEVGVPCRSIRKETETTKVIVIILLYDLVSISYHIGQKHCYPQMKVLSQECWMIRHKFNIIA